MIIVSESAAALKGYLQQTGLKRLAQAMVLRMVLAFLQHRGRMSCSQAAGSVASESVHRGELTRFLARPRWQRVDFNEPLRRALLERENPRGRFVFLIDATLVSQAGQKTENTFSTGNRGRNPARQRRYGQKKVVFKKCHSFTFGLLITPSGIRIPQQIPHYTKEYCAAQGLVHRTTAEAAAELIRGLPLPEGADVVVIGDTAYDAQVVQEACEERGYTWIVPANPERVYAGPQGQRAKLRSRLQDWKRLSLQSIRLRASTGKYARYRRLSRWRVGPKQKSRVYYAHQEEREVRSVGRVQLVFSTTKPQLQKATPDDVKILMTNARGLSVSEVIELYSLRWQIELFFKELKSTLSLCPVQLSAVRGGPRLGGDRAHQRAVPGGAARSSPERPPAEQTGAALVGRSTPARTVRRVPPGMHRPRAEVPLESTKNPWRHRPPATPAHRRNPPGIPSRCLKTPRKSATSKSVSEAVPSAARRGPRGLPRNLPGDLLILLLHSSGAGRIIAAVKATSWARQTSNLPRPVRGQGVLLGFEAFCSEKEVQHGTVEAVARPRGMPIRWHLLQPDLQFPRTGSGAGGASHAPGRRCGRRPTAARPTTARSARTAAGR
jgi:hypothetical protein